MENNIASLEPRGVWEIFDQITKVPRPSKQEEKIREYLRNFGASHNLEVKEDEKGNIVIVRPASKGYENSSAVILQTHMDMVCEKDSSSTHNFSTDPIQTYIEDGWVRAKGTTLGADCGIGMAMAMAALIDPKVEGPALEALFTVDEEQGLTGAMELSADMLTGDRMINLDSEDDGEIFIGCAGGVDTIGRMTYEPKNAPEHDYNYLRISVGGLMGGHSGDDINKGYANAIKLANRLVAKAFEHDSHAIRLAEIQGGNLRNAIPREAWAIIATPENMTEQIKGELSALAQDLKAEFMHTEPNMNIIIDSAAPVKHVLGKTKASTLVALLAALPHGPQAMSRTMEGLVETSTNLASVKFNNNTIEIVTSQRSSVESAKKDIANTVASVFSLSGTEYEHTDGYPGWTPNPASPFVAMSAKLYEDMFGQKAKVKAIHAGLECGLILTKYPHLDIISIGPTLRGVHSPSERIEISTVARQWDYLKAILAKK